MTSPARKIDMKKGELVGEGVTSCIIKNPPFRCTNGRYLDNFDLNKKDLVTKIIYFGRGEKTTKQLFNEEFAKAEKLASIDPTQKYFIYPIEGCKLTLDEGISPESIKDYMLAKCNRIKKNNENAKTHLDKNYKELYLLRMPYGGQSLKEYVSETILSDELINNILGQIINCLTKLFANEISHGDLKLDSVLYDKENNSIRLSDFGETNTQIKDISQIKPNIIKELALIQIRLRGGEISKYVTSLQSIKSSKVETNLISISGELEELYTNSLSKEEAEIYNSEKLRRLLAQAQAHQLNDGSPNATPPHGRHHGSPSAAPPGSHKREGGPSRSRVSPLGLHKKHKNSGSPPLIRW